MKRIKESDVVYKKSFRPSRVVMFQRDDGAYATYVEMIPGEGSPSLTYGVFYDTYEQTQSYLSFRNALGFSTLSAGSRLLLSPKVHFVPLPFNGNIFAR